MPDKNRIALAVPAYNAARFLPRLFASVAAQTSPFDEIWVYDDCSSDDTAEVAKSFGAHVVLGDVNRGWCEGKNALLERVNCDWIHFHDADDVIAPEFVARAKARIAREVFDALLFDHEVVEEETGVWLLKTNFSETNLLEDPLRYVFANEVHHSCGVYSTHFLRWVGGFDTDPSLLHCEERAFHMRLAENGARFAIEPYVGSRIHYSRHGTWASKRIKCCLAAHEINKRFAERYPGRYSKEIASRSWQCVTDLASCLDWKAADACLSLACANGGRIPANGTPSFRLICAISPYLAIRMREWLIRITKPHLRAKESY